VGLAALGVRLACMAHSGLTYEDALISLRYAANWAGGHGLVYNPGERVFGATTPLYVGLLCFFTALKAASPLFWGKLVCAAADAVTAGLWYAAIGSRTGSRFAGLTFAVMFGLSPFIVEVSVSGMETSLVLLGVTVAFLAAQAERPVLLGLAIGLTALVRLDTLLFGGLLLLDRVLRIGRPRVGSPCGPRLRLPWREAAVAAGCLAPWLLFAGLYYGSVVPNSVAAKFAAYNVHRPSILPTLKYSWSFFGPFRNGAREEWFNGAAMLLFALGGARILRRHRDWWLIPAFFFAQWAFLVFPRSILFRWYLPPALLPYYVVGGVGAAELWLATRSLARRVPRAHAAPAAAWLLLVALAVHTGHWLHGSAERDRKLQLVEDRTRRDIGVWLARNTPPEATVCTEPIGYIGYYSGRRILDEVGLISPELIPLNRAGDGWFARALETYRPDYVVERYYFLRRNATINVSDVKMFASAEDRRWFDREYEPLRWYCRDVSPFPTVAYAFIIFGRRDRARLTHHGGGEAGGILSPRRHGDAEKGARRRTL
jgi:hypothetical protein